MSLFEDRSRRRFIKSFVLGTASAIVAGQPWRGAFLAQAAPATVPCWLFLSRPRQPWLGKRVLCAGHLLSPRGLRRAALRFIRGEYHLPVSRIAILHRRK